MKRNTKELILTESLKLFSVKGYEGVSVRDIAEKLEIKQSSLYKHYSGKKDIFENIVKKMNKDFNMKMQELKVPGGNFADMAEGYKAMSFKDIAEIGRSLFIYWTQNEFAVAFRKMLMLEQYKDSEIKELYQNYVLTGTLKYQEQLFYEMIKEGIFIEADPALMALDFYGPIFTLINCSDIDTYKSQEEIMAIMDKHMKHFSEVYERK